MLINRADSIASYERFIARVNEGQAVWLILDTNEYLPAACNSNEKEGRFVVPIWSDRALAFRAKPRFPEGYELIQIPRDKFLSMTVPFLADQKEWVGPNWTAELAGLEVDPKEVLQRLSS